MVLPFITAITRDVFLTVPPVLKEAAYGVGCTTWEVVRKVVLPYTRVGVIGGVMLGLGRALGETMAVTFVIGNAHRISASILAPGTTISASIANEFNEAVGDLYTSSLIALGLILFVITFIVLAAARLHADADREEPRLMKSMARYNRRRRRNAVTMALSVAATAFGAAWLVVILATLLWNGFSGLSLEVFTVNTPPPGSAGGLANAIVGSLILTVMGVVIGTPIGILAGTYMAEYGRYSRLTSVVRFVNDILLSAPSIVIGLFVYEIMVARMGHFSGLGRRRGARHPGPAGGHPHHRGHAAAGARFAARGRLRPRLAALEADRRRLLSRRPRRHRHRRAAGHRPHHRRDRAAALHRAQQPVLEPRPRTRRWPTCRSPSSSSRCRPTTTGSSSPGPAR